MADAAMVADIYPSASVLPENVLRFYLHFSAPMAPGRSHEFVTLRDESGHPDREAFMVFTQELWNADRTRLTLLVDPGRIKKSIAASRGPGPALVEGRRYTLTIDAGWPTADGSLTLVAFSRHFRVGPALRHLPSVGEWHRTEPEPGSTDLFVITFDRPFDRHLLADAIEIVGGDGRSIEGAAMVGHDEMSWSFIPAAPWPTDAVHVRVADRLEDVAGNSLRELVERDLCGDKAASPSTEQPTQPTDPQRGDPCHV